MTCASKGVAQSPQSSKVISTTHQSASTVNETPAAAVPRTPRRAFFPTEELYFEVHRICLKNKCKINQEKTESAVVVDTGIELRQRKTPIPIWECPYAVLFGGGRGVGNDWEGGTHLQSFCLCNCMWVDFQSISTRLVNFSPGFSGFLLCQTFQPY